jgi:hypothetical protein
MYNVLTLCGCYLFTVFGLENRKVRFTTDTKERMDIKEIETVITYLSA